MVAQEVGGPPGCLAVDVVRSGLDPLTGRTLVSNHVPLAAWAGHLCDLLLSGAIRDADGVATVDAAAAPPDHPLVRAALEQLTPALPRVWRGLFGPRVVDVNVVAARTRQWLVETGAWSQRRTLWGRRWAETPAAALAAGTGPGDPAIRRHARDTLVHLARYGSTGSATLRLADRPERRSPLDVVLVTVDDLVAWRASNPSLPGARGLL